MGDRPCLPLRHNQSESRLRVHQRRGDRVASPWENSSSVPYYPAPYTQGLAQSLLFR